MLEGVMAMDRFDAVIGQCMERFIEVGHNVYASQRHPIHVVKAGDLPLPAAQVQADCCTLIQIGKNRGIDDSHNQKWSTLGKKAVQVWLQLAEPNLIRHLFWQP